MLHCALVLLLVVAIIFARYATSIPPARISDRLTAYTWRIDRDNVCRKSPSIYDAWNFLTSKTPKKPKRQKDTLIQSVLSLRTLITRYTPVHLRSIVLTSWFEFISADALLIWKSPLCNGSGGRVSTLRRTSFPSGYRTSIEVQFTGSGEIEVYN